MAHPYARKRARRFLVGRLGHRVGSNGRGCHTSVGQTGSTYDEGAIPDMYTLRCTATLPVHGEHPMQHSGRRLPLPVVAYPFSTRCVSAGSLRACEALSQARFL